MVEEGSLLSTRMQLFREPAGICAGFAFCWSEFAGLRILVSCEFELLIGLECEAQLMVRLGIRWF